MIEVFPPGGKEGVEYRQVLVDIVKLINESLVSDDKDIFFWVNKVSLDLAETKEEARDKQWAT